MSRTYRCRHLPIHSGRWMAKKIVDGRGYGFRNRRDYAEQETEKILGPKPSWRQILVKVSGGTHRTWNNSTYTYEIHKGVRKTSYELWYWNWYCDQIADNWVAPIGGFHKWQRTPPAGSRKKYYRTQGNRLLRRRAKMILHDEIIDEDWTGHFPHKNEGFNWWDVY